MCRRLANSILPAFPSGILGKASKQIMPSSGSPKECLQLPLALSILQSTAKVVRYARLQKVPSAKSHINVQPALVPVIRKLFTLYSSEDYDKLWASGRLIQSLILWDTLKYSLISTEIASRGKSKAGLVGSLSMEALYGELHSSSEFILSLLMHAAQTTRFSSHHDVQLRLRAIQLLAGSICFGVSGDKFLDSDKKRGRVKL